MLTCVIHKASTAIRHSECGTPKESEPFMLPGRFLFPDRCADGVQSLTVMRNSLEEVLPMKDYIIATNGEKTCFYHCDMHNALENASSALPDEQVYEAFIEPIYSFVRTTPRLSYFAGRSCAVCLSKDALTVRIWPLALPCSPDSSRAPRNNSEDSPLLPPADATLPSWDPPKPMTNDFADEAHADSNRDNLPDDAVPRALKPEGPHDVQVAWKVFCALRLSLVDEASLFHAFPMDLHGYLLGLFPNTKPLYSINASARVTSMHCSESKIELSPVQPEHLILFATTDHWFYAYLFNSGSMELERLHKARFGDGKDENEDLVFIEIHYHVGRNDALSSFLHEIEFTVATRGGRIGLCRFGKEPNEVYFFSYEWKLPSDESVKKLIKDKSEDTDSVKTFDVWTYLPWDTPVFDREGQKVSHHGGTTDVFAVELSEHYPAPSDEEGSDHSRLSDYSITRLACAPDASFVAVVMGPFLHLLEVSTRKIFHSWMCFSEITDVEYNPTKYEIACVYNEGFIIIDLFTLEFKVQKVVKGRRYQSMAFSHDGLILYLGTLGSIDAFSMKCLEDSKDLGVVNFLDSHGRSTEVESWCESLLS